MLQVVYKINKNNKSKKKYIYKVEDEINKNIKYPKPHLMYTALSTPRGSHHPAVSAEYGSTPYT